MDFEKLEKQVSKLESCATAIAGGAKKTAADFDKDAKLRESVRQAMRDFAGTLKTLLMEHLKEWKEPVRPGQLYRDSAAKNFVPGDVAGDALLIKWGGNVTPTAGRDVHDECARFVGVAEKLLPVLKAYRKE